MTRFIKITAKLVIAFLCLWCVGASMAAISGIALDFPFYIYDGGEIPYYRMDAIRVTILLTFSFYSFKYLFSESKQLYPIQFLDAILKIFTFSLLVLSIRTDVAGSEYLTVFILLIMSLVSHIVSRPKLRRYYYSNLNNNIFSI